MSRCGASVLLSPSDSIEQVASHLDIFVSRRAIEESAINSGRLNGRKGETE
jgi:hypothetical protein